MAEESRIYSSRRQSIANAIVEKLKRIDGTGEFLSNVYGNVVPRMKFWDEIDEFPSIHLSVGGETRIYQAGRYKDRFLNITIRCYVNSENSIDELDKLIEDIETVLEDHAKLEYFDKRGVPQAVHQISILNIDTDEGALDPLGVAEFLIEVQY